jgi:iron(II)-dependent oxidoreductase
VAVPSFWIDTFPVTNAQYQAYLNRSGYRPADATNWLTFWDHNGSFSKSHPTPPPDGLRQPVTGVGLAEAHAFCAFYNKRLPSEIEWVYAAQGTDNRTYPWGNVSDAKAYPAPANTTDIDPTPADVDAHPSVSTHKQPAVACGCGSILTQSLPLLGFREPPHSESRTWSATSGSTRQSSEIRGTVL